METQFTHANINGVIQIEEIHNSESKSAQMNGISDFSHLKNSKEFPINFERPLSIALCVRVCVCVPITVWPSSLLKFFGTKIDCAICLDTLRHPSSSRTKTMTAIGSGKLTRFDSEMKNQLFMINCPWNVKDLCV